MGGWVGWVGGMLRPVGRQGGWVGGWENGPELGAGDERALAELGGGGDEGVACGGEREGGWVGGWVGGGIGAAFRGGQQGSFELGE